MLSYYRLDFVWIDQPAANAIPHVRSAYIHTHAIDVVEAARQARCVADMLIITAATTVDATIVPAQQRAGPDALTESVGLRFRSTADAAGRRSG